MVDILCPICNEIIAGEGEWDLSLNLQDHMRAAHGVEKMSDLTLNRAASSRGDESWDKVREEDLAPISYEDQAIMESHGPPERRLPGEDIPQSVLCPFCGDVVRGYAFDDFSYRLAYHVRVSHGIKVKWTGKG